ncbi:DNA-(apurinic or apyrimidinic site) lyase, partial [Zostera marina]
MKRFFQPIEKSVDGSPSSKKVALSSPHESHSGKDDEVGFHRRDPTKFVTWNANSLLLRVKADWKKFSHFVQTINPDVICVQEVRMPSAGCKGAPKNHGQLKDDTASSRQEKQVLMQALSSPPFDDYRVWWSLSDSKYAGTALFVKKQCQPKIVWFNVDRKAGKHEPDGRVILAEFETLILLNTYSPNNGWKDEDNSFKRRRKWDKRILEFVQNSSNKPLIWCGDLNV